MKLDELRAKAKELGETMNTLAGEFEKNGQKWKDDESRAAFNTAKEERAKIEKDLEAILAEEADANDVRDSLRSIQDFDDRVMTRSLPGREDTRSQRPFGSEQITDETRCLALAGWIRGENRSDEQAEAMNACRISSARPLQINGWQTPQLRQAREAMRGVRYERIRDVLEESRALSAFNSSAGGVTVPQTLIRSLEINMLAFGGVRQVAETMTTGNGEEMTWPTANDTSSTGEQLGESTSVGTSVDPSFGAVTWNSYKFSSKPILVPYELLEDSVFNLPGILGEMLGERLGRITATRHTTGSGAGTCKGIVTCSTAGKTTASATAITFDEVQDLIHSIDPAYRQGASFMMHDSIWLYLKKLKDGVGKYYIQEDVTGVATPRLFGYPVYISQEMASSVATTNKTMLFGQLFRHKIRRVNGVRLYRLQERYRDLDQDAFLAFLREDSNMLVSGTQPVKHMLQA